MTDANLSQKEKQQIEQLNEETEQFIRAAVQQGTTTTEDPVDSKGDLVDQNVNPQPIPKSFIIALNEQEAQEQRMAAISHHRSSLLQLQQRYGSYLDERILKNPKSIFVGPNCPWHFAWFEDYDRRREGPRLDQASENLLEMMRQDGYRPANFNDIGPLHVTGEAAALLAIPRSRNVIQALAAKKIALPPPLPPSLWDKFGTVLPPVIAQDGSFWIGRFRLYMIEAVIVRHRKLDLRTQSNGNLHKTGSGINQEPDALQGSYEIDLDAMFGGAGRMFGK